MGDYGAFYYQLALASGYYAPHYDTPDDGTAIVTALTKCDQYSWCSGLARDNLTMTRESWHDGTYSHGWGSSAIVGATLGVIGVHQTAPSFAAFTLKSKLGPLTSASATVPTIRGFITVSATPGAVNVTLPCNVAATLCAPRAAADAGLFTPLTHALLLDGAEAPAVAAGGHLCLATTVGCGAAGAPRQLVVRAR
jgi:Bacterial alpha-L-rhamnosidase C-terminal domain